MSHLRTQALRIASELSVGDPTRKKLVATLRAAGSVYQSMRQGAKAILDGRVALEQGTRAARAVAKKYDRRPEVDAHVGKDGNYWLTVRFKVELTDKALEAFLADMNSLGFPTPGGGDVYNSIVFYQLSK